MINKNFHIIVFILLFISFILQLISQANKNPILAFTSLIIVFSLVCFCTLVSISDHIVLLLFNLSFGLFLMGRFIATSFSDYSAIWYTGLFDMSFENDVVFFILLTLYLSQFVLFIFYFGPMMIKDATNINQRLKPLRLRMLSNAQRPAQLVKKIDAFLVNLLQRLNLKIGLDTRNIGFLKSIQHSALLVFIIAIVFQVIQGVMLFNYTRTYGYNYSYLHPLHIPLLITLVASMYDVALFVYLSTRPNLKRAVYVILLYLFVGALTLVAGRRKEFTLNVLIAMTYLIIRIKGNRTYIKRLGITMLILIPLLILLLSLVDSIRSRSLNYNTNSLFDRFWSFFYAQGVSARVIGYAKVHLNELPSFKFYSFGTVLEFIKYSIIGRIFQGKPVPIGQSIERATEGHLFSQAISWLAIPHDYLRGVGTGSSYIAELYVDFGYVGIVLGNIFYARLISFLNRSLIKSASILTCFTLLVIRGLYFTPRSGFVSFLTTAFGPKQLTAFFVVILLAYIFRFKISRKPIRNMNP